MKNEHVWSQKYTICFRYKKFRFFSGVFTWDSDFTCNSHPQQKNEGSVQYSSKTNRYFYSFKVNIYNCVFFLGLKQKIYFCNIVNELRNILRGLSFHS